MSFPVVHLPDRRLLARNRCAERCIVEYGQDQTADAILRQVDVHGARLRLLQRSPTISGEFRITTAGGEEILGSAAWSIGEVVGVRRRAGPGSR